MQKTLSRLFFISSMVLAASLPVSGRGTASPFLTDCIIQARALKNLSSEAAELLSASKASIFENYIAIVVQMESADSEVADYARILCRRGDLAVVSVPQTRLDDLLSSPGVLRMESGVCAEPVMDMARQMCGVEETLNMPGHYRGRNVAVGFTDIGFDPKHVNFIDPEGNSRVKRLISYSTKALLPISLSTESEISAWETDDADNWHATHVAGILSGSYMPNGYYGVAPEAEIVATTSPLHDGYLLAGCEEVIEYAKQRGIPAVINMSISSSTGSHDGTSLFNEYMRRLSEDAVVCISSGNNGDKWSGCIPYTSTPDKPKMQAVFREYPVSSPFSVKGIADLWAMDNTTFDLNILVYDSANKELVATIPTHHFADGNDYTVVATSTQALAYGVESSQELAQFFASAKVIVSSEINPANNRFNTVVSFEWTNKEENATPTVSARYWLGIEVLPEINRSIQLFASDKVQFMRTGLGYDPDFSNAMSINDLACGDGIVAVGAVNSRYSWPLNGEEHVYGSPEDVGTIASFTSFGTLINGKILPTVCAPGASVVSSISTPYLMQHPDDTSYSARLTANGRDNYWRNASGTSMSSPFTAGVFALMFEANPHLTPAEAITIVENTTTPPPSTDKRWGRGMLNAYEAVKAALSAAGIYSVTTDKEAPLEIIATGSNQFIVRSYNTMINSVEIHDIQGHKMVTYPANGTDEMVLDLNSLQAGIYIITTHTATSSRTIKASVI